MGTFRPPLGFLLLLLTLVFASPRTAVAEPITVNFDVTVTVARGALEELFGAPVGVADVLRGSFIYDPSVPNTSSVPDFGFYPNRTGQTLSIGGATPLTLPIENYQFFDNAPSCIAASVACDAFVGVVSGTIPGFESVQAELSFRAPAGSRQGVTLPTPAELTSMFGAGQFRLDALKIIPDPPFDDFTHVLVGTIQVQEDPAPVVEPGTLMLFGTGVASLFARRKRPRGWPR